MSIIFKAYNNNIIIFDGLSESSRYGVLRGSSSILVKNLKRVQVEESLKDIPEIFATDGNFDFIKKVSFKHKDRLLKELYPYRLFNPIQKDDCFVDCGWLMYGGRPICILPFDYDKYTIKDDFIIGYFERTIKVKHDVGLRFKSEKEYSRLTININTGLSIYEYKKYTVGKVGEFKFKFDFNYRSWLMINRNIQEGIVSVRR